MKKLFFLLCISFFSIQAQDMSKAHHTPHGFTNPFPTYEDRGFGSFFRWMLWERLVQGSKEEPAKPVNFERVENDGLWLRENKEQFSVTWIGHSSLLIQIDGINILTDPVWSKRVSPVSWAGPSRWVEPGVAFKDLPAIDVVLISHNHYDHLDKQTLEMLGNDVWYLVPLGIGEFLVDMGITNFMEMDWWETVKINGIEYVCTPTQHFSGRSLADRNKTLWSSWTIIGKEQRVYFAGDTGYFPGFKEIAQKYGPFDVAAIPIGAYKPRWFMSPVHVDPAQAVDIFVDIQADYFIPIHWGTFSLADEAIDAPPKDLMKAVKSKQLSEEQFKILKHGETFVLPGLNLTNF